MSETTATRIADLLNHDGERVLDMEALAEKRGAKSHRDGAGRTRYTFADDSAITGADGAWDLGYTYCWCWQGAGHTEDCASK